jgi:exodeoxyribonuclease V alpha subunit
VSVLSLPDPFASDQALRAAEPLRSFNEIGVLSAADVHVAMTLTELAGVVDGEVRLAVALAVRAPRLGHVFVDLETVRDTAAVESDEIVDLSELPWPVAAGWVDAVAGCRSLVALGDDDQADQPRLPLRLIDSRLYLDRYWREERQVAADLLAGAGQPLDVDTTLLAASVERLFEGRDDVLQRRAGETAVRQRLTVLAGGPGTGKTTTVARIAALLYEQAAAGGGPVPLIALAAPTGKAAARLRDSVHAEARRLALDEQIRQLLLELNASTIHRLLGSRPGSRGGFRHDRLNCLPHDVVVIDETSMVSLTLMARLLAAVRPDARVVLVGDPGQLIAIEAGAVLRDIVGPAAEGSHASAARAPSFGDGIIVLERVHRFGAGIAAVADAIRRGDGDATIAALGDSAATDVSWLSVDAAAAEAGARSGALARVQDAAAAAGRAVVSAARTGDASAALSALGSFRLLCAHRRGPHGVAVWTAQIERWLSEAIEGFEAFDRDYVGRPLLITQNDYELGLYNGDTGVIVEQAGGRAGAAFEVGGSVVSFAPTRLSAAETVYAMTIHKSQGSQFDTAAVLLPDPDSRLLTRELLYTAVTRASERLIVVGTEEMVRAAVSRPVARATGLRERLWGPAPSGT